MADKFVSILTPERVRYWKQTRFNPIRDLTPETLARQIEEFNAGLVRRFALTMDAIQRRDDVIQCVAPKRAASVQQHEYEIIVDPDAEPAAAEAQVKVLKYFYKNLRATDAVDRNQRRGFSLLVEQMMDAIGKRYAVHEIIWRPSPAGLTAIFNFVPLWFFENRTGKLRFLVGDLDLEGIDLEEDGWMTTCGQGIMEACSVAYMFKTLPMKDWLLYCEKHGLPGVHGKTKHPVDSDGWKAVETAVQAVAADFSCVTSLDDVIEKLDFSAQGQLPFEPLVARMDRALASLWRGADLSTISSGANQEGHGASLQGGEEHALQEQDARLLSETLNEQVDRKVLAYHFGEGVEPLAYIKVVVPPQKNVDSDIKVDEFLIKNGVKLSKKSACERYGREEATEGEEALEAAQPEMMPGMPGGGREEGIAFANEARVEKRLLENSLRHVAIAQADVLAPLRERVQAVYDMPDEASFKVALHNLRDDLPNLLRVINKNPAAENALRSVMAAGLFNGLTGGVVRRHKSLQRPRRAISTPRSVLVRVDGNPIVRGR